MQNVYRMEANDLIFYTDGDEYNYRGGGYSVESIVENTISSSSMTGGGKDKPEKQGVSTIFNSLAIPTTLFLIKPVVGGSSKSSMSYLVEDDYDIQNGGENHDGEKKRKHKGHEDEDDETISDDLYDKLLKMVEVDNKPKKQKTRKNKQSIVQKKMKKTTRRNIE